MFLFFSKKNAEEIFTGAFFDFYINL